jgi:hypothetical protein
VTAGQHMGPVLRLYVPPSGKLALIGHWQLLQLHGPLWVPWLLTAKLKLVHLSPCPHTDRSELRAGAPTMAVLWGWTGHSAMSRHFLCSFEEI